MFETYEAQPLLNPIANMVGVLIRQPMIKKEKRRIKKGKRGRMRNLNYSLKQLCKRNPDRSYSTQAHREQRLTLIANQLFELGFRHMDAHSLKQKHIEALTAKWIADEISPGAIKNRMTDLRWWAEKIGKENIIAKSNAAYGIANRTFVTNVSKARELAASQLAKVTDLYSKMSLRLQAEFGLRREESLKCQPAIADDGDKLVLKDTWCKGKREREIPIRNESQRQLLNEAKILAGKGSLIPQDMSYKQQLERFKNQCGKAGIDNVHGHRHHYAQERYRELTGRECPARGGPKSKELTKEQKAQDRAVRLTISRELGHGREQVTSIYLGR